MYGFGNLGAAGKALAVSTDTILRFGVIAEEKVEAFIVCRNFDPTKVPLPEVFSAKALNELETQTTGTLTLESLAQLGDSTTRSREWDVLKAYVGSGDLKCVSDRKYTEMLILVQSYEHRSTSWTEPRTTST